MEQQKKKRGENWSSEEKEVLRQLIGESKDVIEDKSTKTSANFLKMKEWKNISNKFNEICGKFRSEGELKLAWKRMKLAAKSNLSKFRKDQNKTGGGDKPPSPSPEDLEIMGIAPHDFHVEINNYDSDALVLETATIIEPNVDPKPGPSSIEMPKYNFELPVENIEEPQNDNLPKNIKNTRNINKKTKSLRNKRQEDIRHEIVQTNTNFKEQQLHMMEMEHKYNIEIAKLQIKKLQLEISLLENKCN